MEYIGQKATILYFKEDFAVICTRVGKLLKYYPSNRNKQIRMDKALNKFNNSYWKSYRDNYLKPYKIGEIVVIDSFDVKEF